VQKFGIIEATVMMKPSGNHLLDDAIASVEGRIRRAAIETGRLIRGPLQRLSGLVSKRVERAAQSRRLQSFDDHMLADIGLSRREAERWPSGAASGDHRPPLSHDLYFQARRERAEMAGRALKSALAAAARYVRHRSRTRDGTRRGR